MKVTLGLCVKNNEKTISTTLQSICNQSYPFYCTELVVVDGMSRDNTLSIIRDYLESNAKFEYMILSDEGKGLAYARQMVLDNSNSGFIVWVDGDHILPKNYVQRQIDFMLKNPELGAAEAITFPAPNSNWIAKLEGCTWTVYGLKRIGRYLSSVGSAGVIYRKRAMLDAGGYDIRFKTAGEDGDISRRIVKQGWKLSMNHRAYYYHICRDSFKKLFQEYFHWGAGARLVNKKHPGSVMPARFLLAPIAGLKLAVDAVKLFHDPIMLALPIHYSVKRAGWLLGYFSSESKEQDI